MFELVKWYMDVVAEDGRAVFAYSAKLRWGTARVSVGSYCHRNIAGVLLVWIDWHDGPATRWIFLDGAEQPHAQLKPLGIDSLTDNRSFRFGSPAELIHRPAVTSVARLAPRLAEELA